MGALAVDRPDRQRARDGLTPGAHLVARNLLEQRLDPACPHRDPQLGRPGVPLVLICNEGCQSSLAAATVQRFARPAVTDVIGGFRAWRAAGLPIQPYAAKGPVMRALDCPCGHHLEAADDDELFLEARAHIDRDHPETQRSDADIRARVATHAYDVERVA